MWDESYGLRFVRGFSGFRSLLDVHFNCMVKIKKKGSKDVDGGIIHEFGQFEI
jgi:hypothetical protein